jgi:putative FmdB family regulatory protein
MPTYEYECRTCNHTFEKFQPMSDDPIKVCPECGGAVRRMIGGGTGIIFKGSGFYITDSKKASSASKPVSATAAAAASASAPASNTAPTPASSSKSCETCSSNAKKESA